MVREVVRAVSYSNREKTSKKNVKIVQDINLPPILIFGDPVRLHQVLGNLIGNSLKFTDDGCITIGARIDSETQDTATLTFWVKDTGIGISSQQLENLFQPFSQADASTARKYGGSGLGLSICKSLIETMMKGKIHLESQVNMGTTAWFTVVFDKARPEVLAGEVQGTPGPLPLEPGRPRSSSVLHAPERLLPPPASYIDLTQIPREELRICIAEDNKINAKIAMQYMHRLGYPHVDTYENGLVAVEGLREMAKKGAPYHIILMDVQMPVLDGYQATRLLRSDALEPVRKILVIAMTASAIQGDREKCLDAGMNDYLAKPVRSEVLKKKLEAYLGTQHHTFDHKRTNSTSSATSSTPSPPTNGAKIPYPATAVAVPTTDGLADGNRASIETIQSDAPSLSETTSSGKRQPRKLTKNRNPSETALEKPKAVLQKKNSRGQSGAPMDSADEQGLDVVPGLDG